MPDDFNAMDQIYTVNQINREFNSFVPNGLFLYALKLLTYLFSMHLSPSPKNIRKPLGFMMFSGGREWVHWERIC